MLRQWWTRCSKDIDLEWSHLKGAADDSSGKLGATVIPNLLGSATFPGVKRQTYRILPFYEGIRGEG